MKKGLSNRNLSLLLLGLFVVSLFIFAVASVSAEEDPMPNTIIDGVKVPDPNLQSDSQDTDNAAGSIPVANIGFGGLFKFDFKEKRDLWLKGGKNLTQGELDNVGNILKYLLLFMIIILIYAAMTSARFPKNWVLRAVFSFIVGVLATFMITTKELIALMNSYTALGLALGTFIPILVLVMITIFVASSFNPVGIFASRLLWAAYSLFLFFKTALVWLASRYLTVASTSTPGEYILKTLPGVKGVPSYITFLLGQTSVTDAAGNTRYFLTRGAEESLTRSLSTSDPTVLFILAMLSIFIFIFMVIKANWIYEWIDKTKRESEVSAARSIKKRADDMDKIQAERLKNSGSPDL